MTAPAVEAPRPFPVEDCRSCHNPVIWTKTERGKAMPVDAEPSKDGTVSLRWAHDATTVLSTVPKPHLAFGRRDLHKSHFATCKDAGAWRRGRRSGRS